MAIADILTSLLQLPKRKARGGSATSSTNTFRAGQPLVTAPIYRDHTTDIFSSRAANDSRTLLEQLINHDPDVSAAVHAYLAVAGSSQLVLKAYLPDGTLDREGIKLANQILKAITSTFDYSVGFSNKPSLEQLQSELRYGVLLRGVLGCELVFDKKLVPYELRNVDMSTVQWKEAKPGDYKPVQKPAGSNEEIDLNIPTFFVARYNQNPYQIYNYSPFVSVINTCAARQQVINELYRIMQVVGYPRMDIEVLEEVLLKHAPANMRNNLEKMREFVQREIALVQQSLATMRSDQAFVHSDAVTTKIINDKNPGAGMEITSVIDVLDAQNSSALKVMPAVVGKSTNVTTASTEARLFAMSADALNWTVAAIFTQALSLAARLAGYAGYIEAVFEPVEMRPVLELEPQKTMKASRLKEDLSLGIITDDEYHMAMYGRPRPDSAPELSGTGFMAAGTGASVDVEGISPNDGSLQRDLAPDGSKSARSKTVKKARTAMDVVHEMARLTEKAA